MVINLSVLVKFKVKDAYFVAAFTAILVTEKVRYYGRPWPDSSPVINRLFRNTIVTRALESGLFLYAKWDNSGSDPFYSFYAGRQNNLSACYEKPLFSHSLGR